MSKAKNIKKQATRRAAKTEVAFDEGSHNPFADMGFANPELELAKSRLVMEIGRVIEERGLSQVAAGRIIGLAQPKLSQLLNGHWKSYSVDRLTRYLNKLGVTVRVNFERNRATWKEGRFIVAER
ncbi:MAG TPA: helix-turn-helix transcriptional regulator [Dongiaceae bacterium]|nr:helix-turn-helix transcriptional regulator [Dongiaceae bacterium]